MRILCSVEVGPCPRRSARGDQQGTGQVEPGRLRGAGRDDCGQGGEDGEVDGHVDVEDPLPAGSVGEGAPYQDPGRRARAADRGPYAQGLVALGAVEGGGDDRERRGGEQGGSDALGDPSAQQHGGTPGEPGDQGSGDGSRSRMVGLPGAQPGT
ncbi:hypothetical protein ADK57_35425 [Streptomyces sp. MMG1533]|nr:hypothetical protein ADK57_35425 [Streptomyces sp. MMG1533]